MSPEIGSAVRSRITRSGCTPAQPVADEENAICSALKCGARRYPLFGQACLCLNRRRNLAEWPKFYAARSVLAQNQGFSPVLHCSTACRVVGGILALSDMWTRRWLGPGACLQARGSGHLLSKEASCRQPTGTSVPVGCLLSGHTRCWTAVDGVTDRQAVLASIGAASGEDFR